MTRSTIVILMLLGCPAPQALAEFAETSSPTAVALKLPRLSNGALASALDEQAKGLGTDHWSIEPAFLVYQELSRAVAIEGQFAALAPFGGSNGIPASSDKKFAGTVLSYGVGPSVAVYQTAKMRVAPVVELVGWHVIDGFETSTNADPAAEANTFNIKYGGRISWKGAADSATGGSFYVGFGHALTDAKWYDDILRVEYRLTF